MEQIISLKYVVGSLLYSAIGVIIFVVAFIALDKATPGDLWKEIIAEKNMAVAILAGAALIGIALIISSAIHG